MNEERLHAVETPEAKKERLLRMFRSSQEVFSDPDLPLSEGTISVHRDHKGRIEKINGLVVLEVLDDGVELGVVEEDGEIGPSAFMPWDEIVDVEKPKVESA